MIVVPKIILGLTRRVNDVEDQLEKKKTKQWRRVNIGFESKCGRVSWRDKGTN